MSDFSCNDLCSKLSTHKFKPGDKIIKEGEIGENMFIIIKGNVEIYKENIEGFIDIVGPENIVGTTSLESDCIRTATVIAKNHVTALQLTKDDYLSIAMRQKHKQRSGIVNLLKNLKFFKDLMGARLDMLA